MPRTSRRKPPRRRAKQQRAKETVEVILRASAQLLGAGGAPFTTNRVAERAGVSIGTLYQYFPDKDALVAEVRRRYDDAFRERLLGVVKRVAGRPLREAVAECVRTLIALHVDDAGLHNAVSAGVTDAERRLLEQVVASFLEARRREVRRPDLVLAAAVSLEAVEALVHGAALRVPERLADPRFADEVTDLLVRYLGK